MKISLVGVLVFFVMVGSVSLAQASDCDAVDGNLVSNCGFETFDATDWVVERNGADFAVVSVHARSGSVGVGVENDVPYTTLSQQIQTVEGSNYEVSFYLRNFEPSATSFFKVWWGANEVAESNHDSNEWIKYSYEVQATAELTELVIGLGTSTGEGAIGLDDIAVVLLSDQGSTAPPDTFRVLLEEPVKSGIVSGISNVRGWAVSSQGIQKVELFVDGQYAYEIPYGGQRFDVEARFPDIPQSAESGFGQTYNYGGLSLGEHTMTVRAYAGDGSVKDSTNTFTVVGFGQEFISASDSPSTDNASASVESSNGDIVIRDIELDSGERFEVRLRWDTAAQSYKAVAVQPLN